MVVIVASELSQLMVDEEVDIDELEGTEPLDEVEEVVDDIVIPLSEVVDVADKETSEVQDSIVVDEEVVDIAEPELNEQPQRQLEIEVWDYALIYLEPTNVLLEVVDEEVGTAADFDVMVVEIEEGEVVEAARLLLVEVEVVVEFIEPQTADIELVEYLLSDISVENIQ